ncbi:hypothetical protein JWG42_11490 [Desulfoprunum benzoelyticum]|uniref:Putative delta-60 repeat protein n=1 Tax=Desulfoprunum benzoelyticum TaxID=1506996 RepID=A0A840V0X4_9BACT|nr:CFI-box-CTERM domain-containing protein [Desulfoprunum benzoelyticum]MBB5347359.1 putative delta-60 repeat protein [Desulfoprunum benzoelyticum]MBM9530773.1 hypothetical protein [Desulfoprunum benzoelyticum]
MCEIKTEFRIIMLLVVTILLSVVSVHAGGNLDPAFGEQGVVVTDFGIDDDEALALAVQADGKILLAGFSTNSVVKDVAVARYHQDGKLDTSFQTTGYTTFNVGGGNAMARAIVVQEDGRIVIAGTADNGANAASSAVFLARLNENGALDPAFGTGGILVLPLDDKSGVAYDLQLTLDGDILVAGTAGGSNGQQAMIARVKQDGKRDTTFGTDGVVLLDREYETAAHSLVVQSDNTILIAGYSKPEEVAGLSLVRLQADGAIDESFGVKGEVRITDTEGEAILYDMAAQADGRLVVVGTYDNSEYREIILGRFLTNGQLDNSFGTAGIVRSDLGYDSVGYGVAVQNDGAIVVTGYSQTMKGKDIILLRYGVEQSAAEGSSAGATETATETTGAPADTDLVASFANTAVTSQTETAGEGSTPSAATDVTTTAAAADAAIATFIADAVSLYDDVGRALAVLPDGRVLAAGYSSNGDDNDFVLLQYSVAAMSALAESTALAAGGVSSTYYHISTTPIFDIGRNNAMSGGAIAKVADSSEITVPTVTTRGVCYGTARHPVYRPADTTDTTDTADSTDPVILPATTNDSSFNYKTVLYGQTSDGSGVGTFGSNIVEITPNTRYYVRAYAVLSDETVIYGNELSFETSDACFIATAAYGSVLDAHVVVLRNFRDRYLRGNALGQAFIDRYYRFSPKIAEVIERNAVLKQVVRVGLWPWVAFSYLMLEFAVWVKITLLLLAALVGGAAVYSFKSNAKARNTL